MKTFLKHYLLLILLLPLMACGTGSGGVGFGLSAVQTGGIEKSADNETFEDTEGMFEGAASDPVSGGVANQVGAPNNNAPGTTQYSAPMEPVDIPITVAKTEKAKPDVNKITVKIDALEDEEDSDEPGDPGQPSDGPKKMVKFSMIMTGAPGAILDPIETPFVYFYNPATGVETFVKVEADGSFKTEALSYEIKKPLVVAASDKETISEPVIFRSSNAHVYTWRTYQTFLPIQTSTFIRENIGSPIFTISYRIASPQSDTEAADIDLTKPQDGVRISAAKPRITLTDENGEAREIDDQRILTDQSVVFRTDKGIFEINDERMQELTTFDRNEKINRWDILKKQPDARFIPQDQSVAAQKTRYVGVISENGVRLINSHKNKIVFDKSFKELSVETTNLISSDADMDLIIHSILKRSLISPDQQLSPRL